jgi:uncharacterized membrane protein YqjE
MKFKKGLFLAWIIPHVFLLLINLTVLIIIVANYHDLNNVNRSGVWITFWILFSLVWIFGTLRIYQWYKQGQFHSDKEDHPI